MKPEYDSVSWGGGQTGYRIIRPTLTEKLYACLKGVYLRVDQKTNDLVFDVIKDRTNGNNGIKDVDHAIDFCAEMLCQLKFNDRNHMFQTSLFLKLQEVMKKVLIEDDYIPSEKVIKDYIEKE